MKMLFLATVILLCNTRMHYASAWKAVAITQTQTVVKVESCLDPQIYLQFEEPITVSPIGNILTFSRISPSNRAKM